MHLTGSNYGFFFRPAGSSLFRAAAGKLKNVQQIQSAHSAFAALLADGSVVSRLLVDCASYSETTVISLWLNSLAGEDVCFYLLHPVLSSFASLPRSPGVIPPSVAIAVAWRSSLIYLAKPIVKRSWARPAGTVDLTFGCLEGGFAGK